MAGRISRWSSVAHHLVRADIDTDWGSIGGLGSLGLGRCIPQACLTKSRLTQLFRVTVDRSPSPMGTQQEVMIYVEVALRGAPGATGALRGFVPRPPRPRGPGDVRRPAKVGLALVDRRRRNLGPDPGLRRIPDLRGLARRRRSSAVYPRGAGGDGVVGTAWLVVGTGYGRSYPLARLDGGLLRSHESAADRSRSVRFVGRRNRSVAGSGHLGPLKPPKPSDRHFPNEELSPQPPSAWSRGAASCTLCFAKCRMQTSHDTSSNGPQRRRPYSFTLTS